MFPEPASPSVSIFNGSLPTSAWATGNAGNTAYNQHFLTLTVVAKENPNLPTAAKALGAVTYVRSIPFVGLIDPLTNLLTLCYNQSLQLTSTQVCQNAGETKGNGNNSYQNGTCGPGKKKN